MPECRVGFSNQQLLTVRLELHQIESSPLPTPRLLISTVWLPIQPLNNEQLRSIAVREPRLEVRYAMPDSALHTRGQVDPLLAYRRQPSAGDLLGIAEPAPDISEHGTSWQGQYPSEAEVTFSLSMEQSALERLERLRGGSDFVLIVYPRGQVERLSAYVTQPGVDPGPNAQTNTIIAYLRGIDGIPLHVPRSRWSDLLGLAGLTDGAHTPEGPHEMAEARAAALLLQQAKRHILLGEYPEAGTYARKAFETISEVIGPRFPDKDQASPVGMRIKWVAWAGNRLCHPAAHVEGVASFGRAEAMLAVQIVAALVGYVGTPGTDRGSPLTGGDAVTQIDGPRESP